MQTRWGPAIGLGLVAAIVGGAIWGVIAGLSGYILGIVSFVIGIAVAAAIRHVAGRITPGVIALAVLLTMPGVIVGDVIGLTILIGRLGYDITILDVLAAYPEIVAASPGDAAIAYAFGLIGAAAAASRLYREMKAVQELHPNVPPQTATHAPVMLTGSQPVVEILARTLTTAGVRVAMPGPPSHTIEASFEATLGGATVLLDRQLYEKVRVWGRQKVIEVAMDGSSAHVVSFRFHGAVTPRIEVRLDGQPLANV